MPARRRHVQFGAGVVVERDSTFADPAIRCGDVPFGVSLGIERALTVRSPAIRRG
ncbi:hypothetical protein [Nocardia colli]|uniref:hypothetical protein n=1 Tax=Nocardia colli TaxID=2545717 RepID=UPI00168D2D23|nr:hypothetical protein [Nocardia colli]